MISQIFLIAKTICVAFSISISRLNLILSTLRHRLTYRAVPDAQNIVIIGASFAGYQAARDLSNAVPAGYRVIIIEKNSHFQFTWVFPRMCVVGGHEHKALIPYGPYLTGAPRGSYEWISGRVSKIEAEEKGGSIQLSSGENIEYAYLILATGAEAGAPSRLGKESKKDAIQVFKTEQERLKAAKDVVVIGGGAAGVEIAGDAKAAYPEKNVTLVHSRSALLNTFGPKLQKLAASELEKLGVNIILQERLREVDDATGDVVLKSGKKITCDCLIKCVGQKANSDLLTEISPSSILPSGHVKVLPTLQIADPSHGNIFAIGDVTDAPIKNGRSAVEQGQLVSRNVVRAIKEQKLLDYHPQWWEGLTEVTLGLRKKVAYLNDGSAEMIFSTSTKDPALRSAQCWRLFGVKPYEDPSETAANKRRD
ncbi:mercuric reductase, putative [Paecilomyces variotii No. 5]|uniref:Mercuric reductase, putative n=1 Tax=Byssochlamys spectabilis (strain No. 5 / NBRC 109023) TaxID=1356009 RepID=V5I1V3_BYSSN|nr:mercuric reductase, putative [Paecilomyces variotii No. 5]